MTIVTATELKTNMGKYLSMIGKEDIVISKNGKLIACLTQYKSRVSDSLIGILDDSELPEDFDGDYRRYIREERYKDYEDPDRY